MPCIEYTSEVHFHQNPPQEQGPDVELILQMAVQSEKEEALRRRLNLPNWGRDTWWIS
jgi:hypothetical protein